MGFDLRLRNVPVGAVLWHADFAENSFKYDPIADSSWLAINLPWLYPSDPLGCTTLRIMIVDAYNNLLFYIENLGPVKDGWVYIYDCSTRRLIECRLEGSIIDKVILHNTESLSIPAEMLLGEWGQIQIRGRNDDLAPQQMGTYWKVTFDNVIVEELTQWADELAPPGYILDSKGHLLPFSEEKTYKLVLELLMNKDCPEVVDFYSGDLCTVVEEVPTEAEFRDFAISEYTKQ